MIATCLHEHRIVSYSRVGDEPADSYEQVMELDYYINEPNHEPTYGAHSHGELIHREPTYGEPTHGEPTHGEPINGPNREPGAILGAERGICATDNGCWPIAMSYGFVVAKTEGGIHEEACVDDVTINYDRAKKILNLLADNQVTPCCLREILEDICATEYTV